TAIGRHRRIGTGCRGHYRIDDLRQLYETASVARRTEPEEHPYRYGRLAQTHRHQCTRIQFGHRPDGRLARPPTLVDEVARYQRTQSLRGYPRYGTCGRPVTGG